MKNPVEALMDAHERLKLPPIVKMSGKRWEGTCGPWFWLVNASRVPITLRAVTVPAFHTYIEYRGWPAGVLDAVGEGQFAAGSGANMESFTAALSEWLGPRA